MGTQTFLNNLKEYADRLKEETQNLDEFYGFFEENYDVYISATPEEREKIREFVISPPHEDNKPKSFFEKLFKPSQNTSDITGLLVRYIRYRALPQLDSTGDEKWLISGLVAISMENCYSDWRDTLTFLKDFYQAAEIKGMNPEPYFLKIAGISSDKNQKYVDTPMKEMMAKIEWFKSEKE
jgi:hypothetical protein